MTRRDARAVESVFAAEFDSIARAVAKAEPEKRLHVFGQVCREPADWVAKGRFAEQAVVDRLRAIAAANGLAADAAEAVIAAAIADPFDAAAFARKERERVRPQRRREKARSASDGRPTERDSARDRLVAITDRASCWRCRDGDAYATIEIGDHKEHHRVRSGRFRDWLLVEAGRAYRIKVAGKDRPATFGRQPVEEAIAFCEAAAAMSGAVNDARLRVAAARDAVYIDLAGPTWDAVEIKDGKWEIVLSPAVPILRTPRTGVLPRPVYGGSLEPLFRFLPQLSKSDQRLVIIWLLAAMRPTGPYPILALAGEEGTGKSMMARLLRQLVDPAGDNVMRPPHNDGDLVADARNNHVLAYDNLSRMSDDLADGFCRLSTGGDIGGRRLYTNDESAAFAAKRPIIFNGIPDLATRGDLASRTMVISLAPMTNRRTEADIEEDFRQSSPRIFGALLDALASALATLPNVCLPPEAGDIRMADVAHFGIAVERALGWPAGSTIDALRRNRIMAAAALVEFDPVAQAIRGLLDREPHYHGMVSKLYQLLIERISEEFRQKGGWPRSDAKFGEQLCRVAPALRATGINIVLEPRSSAGSFVTITDNRNVADQPTQPTQPTQSTQADGEASVGSARSVGKFDAFASADGGSRERGVAFEPGRTPPSSSNQDSFDDLEIPAILKRDLPPEEEEVL
jgi:hypothetical protein